MRAYTGTGRVGCPDRALLGTKNPSRVALLASRPDGHHSSRGASARGGLTASPQAERRPSLQQPLDRDRLGQPLNIAPVVGAPHVLVGYALLAESDPGHAGATTGLETGARVASTAPSFMVPLPSCRLISRGFLDSTSCGVGWPSSANTHGRFGLSPTPWFGRSPTPTFGLSPPHISDDHPRRLRTFAHA